MRYVVPPEINRLLTWQSLTPLKHVMINLIQTHSHTHTNPYTLPSLWQSCHCLAAKTQTGQPLPYMNTSIISCDLILPKNNAHTPTHPLPIFLPVICWYGNQHQPVWTLLRGSDFLGLRLVRQHEVCGCRDVCCCSLVSRSSSVCLSLSAALWLQRQSGCSDETRRDDLCVPVHTL